MPYISAKISKAGNSTARVDLPAYKNDRKSLRNNLDEYLHFPDTYFKLIDHQLNLVHYKYFLWHSSGDIVDENYFAGMCRLARKHKKTSFLCFTKKYEIVNNYLENGNYIPKNLTVVFSASGNFPPENPYNLPEKKDGDNYMVSSGVRLSI